MVCVVCVVWCVCACVLCVYVCCVYIVLCVLHVHTPMCVFTCVHSRVVCISYLLYTYTRDGQITPQTTHHPTPPQSSRIDGRVAQPREESSHGVEVLVCVAVLRAAVKKYDKVVCVCVCSWMVCVLVDVCVMVDGECAGGWCVCWWMGVCAGGQCVCWWMVCVLVDGVCAGG